MSLTLITAPAIEPISLDEAKAQCRVDGAADDALITLYIQAARYACEELLCSALITQDWAQNIDEFQVAGDIKLLKPPVQSIVSVTYIDTAGATQVLAPEAYALDRATGPGWLFPADGTEWPSTDDVINSVTITMRCGFGDAAASVPGPIRAWMLLTIGTLYAQRESLDASGKVAALPGRFVDGLLDPWRRYDL